METAKLSVNTILYTKDGRKIGNAIITKQSKCGEFWFFTTDYGNHCGPRTTQEILELFYASLDCPYNQELSEAKISEHKHFNLIEKMQSWER